MSTYAKFHASQQCSHGTLAQCIVVLEDNSQPTPLEVFHTGYKVRVINEENNRWGEGDRASRPPTLPNSHH